MQSALALSKIIFDNLPHLTTTNNVLLQFLEESTFELNARYFASTTLNHVCHDPPLV